MAMAKNKICLYISFPRYFPKNTTIIIHNSLSSIKYWPITSSLRWHAKRHIECYLVHSPRLLMACLLKPQNRDKHHGNIQVSLILEPQGIALQSRRWESSLWRTSRERAAVGGSLGLVCWHLPVCEERGLPKRWSITRSLPQAMMSRLSWQLPFSSFQFP